MGAGFTVAFADRFDEREIERVFIEALLLKDALVNFESVVAAEVEVTSSSLTEWVAPPQTE